MNFLAHCALAADAADAWSCDEEQRRGLIAGALVGDFIKGGIPADWPLPLRAGVRLHRRVDAISNRNHSMRAVSASFPGELRRYAPIFVDILADHALARRWEDFYATARSEFCGSCYRDIASFEDFLTSRGKRFFGYMRDADLLTNYDDWIHVEDGLSSVLRRLGRPDLSREVTAQSQARIELMDNALDRFYPELQEALAGWQAFDAIAEPRNS